MLELSQLSCLVAGIFCYIGGIVDECLNPCIELQDDIFEASVDEFLFFQVFYGSFQVMGLVLKLFVDILIFFTTRRSSLLQLVVESL